MRSLLGREIREDELPAAFLLHGEEGVLARELIREIRSALSSGGAEGPLLERFDPVQTPWRDILDVARTMPFSFSPWRLLVVDIEDSEDQDLRTADSKLLTEYLASPTGRTLLIVTVPGKVRKASSLSRAFAAAPKGTAAVIEMKKPDADDLRDGAKGLLAGLGKTAGRGVIDRFVETAAGDFQRMANEIDQVAAYVGDGKAIEAADVDALIPRVKEPENWALYNAMESGDTAKALRVVAAEFADGAAPPLVLGMIGGFLKRLVMAKSLLREGKDRREVFREMRGRPEFFEAVDAISARDLVRLLEELQAADLKIKSSDVNGRTLLESFLAFYGRVRKGRRATSPGRGRSARPGG